MKKLMLFVLVILAATSMHAQDKRPFQLGVGINFNFPVGELSNGSSFGIGGRAQAEVKTGDQVTVIGSASFNRFFYKSHISESGFNAIPIQAGIRFYPINKFFAGAQLGYAIVSVGGDSKGGFAYNPHVGFNLRVVQIIIGYQGISSKGENLNAIEAGVVLKI